jgi:hypothetical protein
MRILGKNVTNKKLIRDSVSGAVLELSYRTPTASEIVNYGTRVYALAEGKMKINPYARIEFALNILTGIGENCFADETGKAISSDSSSQNYCENWKELLKESAEDILMHFAVNVFEGTNIVNRNGALPEIEGIDSVPFVKSSSDG